RAEGNCSHSTANRVCGGWWRTASRLQTERTTGIKTDPQPADGYICAIGVIDHGMGQDLRQSSAYDFNREECQAIDDACLYGGGLRFQVARLRSKARPCTVGRTVDLTD